MKNNKGFSLIELLVIIAIIGIMTTVSIVSLMASKTQKEVEVAAREVAAAIREAQGYALNGKTVSNSENLCSAQFSFTQSTANYKLSYWSHQSTPGALCPSSSNGDYYSKSLSSNGVTFNSSSGTISFSVPHGIMTPASTVAITLTKSGVSSINVCVYYPTGRVEEKKPGEGC